MAAANHAERGGAVEIGRAGQGGHRNLAGIHRVVERATGFRCRAHTEHAVFRVHDNAGLRCDQVGNQGGYTDTQVDHFTGLQFVEHRLGHGHTRRIHLLGTGRYRGRRAQVFFTGMGLYQEIHEAAGRVNGIGVELAYRDDFFHFGNHKP